MFQFEQPGETRVSYLICSMPRSGSSLLCELLTATGVAGAPTEVFHPDYMALLKHQWQVETLDDYLTELLARKTGPNGVFGAKAHWGQYHPAFEEADPRSIFPNVHVIAITRRDHLRQAVSWVRALQTMRWQSGRAERPQRNAEFDGEHITRKLGRIEREEDAWRGLFARHDIAPHPVVYENLVADQDATVRGVLEFIGVEPPGDLRTEPAIQRQADALSEEWVERYRAEVAQK
jgi:LPS sulfotransferase NodH